MTRRLLTRQTRVKRESLASIEISTQQELSLTRCEKFNSEKGRKIGMFLEDTISAMIIILGISWVTRVSNHSDVIILFLS
jgi:hypothetical protein